MRLRSRSIVQRFKRSMTGLLKVPNVPIVSDVKAKKAAEPIWIFNHWNVGTLGTIGTIAASDVELLNV